MFRLRWSSHTSIPPPLADSPIGLVGNLMTVAPLCFRHAEVRASEYDPPPQPARTSGAARSRLHRRTCIFAILAPANGAHIAREEDRERRAEAERGRAEDRRARPRRLRYRPGDREPERDQSDRAEAVVGGYPRELLLRDLLLDGGVPEDPEDLDPDPGHGGARDHPGERRGHGEDEQERDREQEAERRREEQPVGTEAQQEESADDQPDRLRRENQAPARRAAEVSLRDRRAEHVLRALLDPVDDAELRDDRPQPRAPAELVPALAEPADEARALHAQRRRHAHRADEGGSEEEAGGVDGDADAGARSADDETAERRAADEARVEAEPEERVRALEHRPRDRLRDDPGRGGEEERRARAVQRREGREVPDPGVPGEEERGDRALRQPAGDVRAHHHVVAGQPVAPDSSGQEEDDKRHRAGGEDVAEIGLRAGQVEDGESERDVRERVADERRRPPEEEQPELPLAERSAWQGK